MSLAETPMDPAQGPQGAAARKGWPFAWFERLVDPYVAYDERVPPPAKLFEFYKEMLRPLRGIVALSALFALIVAVLDALMVAFAGRIVDILTVSSPEELWASHGTELMLMAAAAFVLRPLVVALGRLLMGQAFFPSMGAIIRWRTHRHMLRQSVGFFNDDFAGRIANKQIQLAPAFNDTVFQFLEAILYALIYVISAAVIFADTDARLLLPLGLWFGLYIATACWFIPRVTKIGMAVAEARSRLAGRIVDSYTNILTVKLFAHAQHEDEYARDAIEDMRWIFAEQTRLFTRLEIIMTGVNTMLIGGTIGYGVYLWTGGDISVGAIAAAAALVLRLQAMTDWIMWTLSMLFQNIGTVQEGIETVSQPHRLQDAPGAPALKVEKGAVRFEGVSHHYGREGKGLRGAGVNGVDLEIAAGERVGLVGPSGAGKSTLMNLALRLFDPEAGRILIDGQDIRSVTQDSLRRRIGMVTQDTSLLHRSVLANILYGSEGKDEAAAIAAAKQVSAHEFILDLEDRDGRKGYQAHVGERGVKLSGGQRQRIALARVVLKDAPILILDEATSALDSEVEAAILESLYGLMQDKTVIAIAHRLSTIAAMDRIVVLDQGRVVESGGHDALLERGGLYAKLWARQSGGFLGDLGGEGSEAGQPAAE